MCYKQKKTCATARASRPRKTESVAVANTVKKKKRRRGRSAVKDAFVQGRVTSCTKTETGVVHDVQHSEFYKQQKAKGEKVDAESNEAKELGAGNSSMTGREEATTGVAASVQTLGRKGKDVDAKSNGTKGVGVGNSPMPDREEAATEIAASVRTLMAKQ